MHFQDGTAVCEAREFSGSFKADDSLSKAKKTPNLPSKNQLEHADKQGPSPADSREISRVNWIGQPVRRVLLNMALTCANTTKRSF